jgi:prefoldin subunit 5
VRKPLASEVTNVKVLPRSPEENGAANRIESLKAKLNDLSRRRGNIDTIINELTQVVQPSSIAYDLATRGEVKKTVESLNKELAEIKKEEYELGMKLMRAYKKQDQEDYYGETSAIWIKRVAS